MTPPTDAERLILRGIHLLLRTSFSPNGEEARVKHYVALQNDIGPWLGDYVEAMTGSKPEGDSGSSQTD